MGTVILSAAKNLVVRRGFCPDPEILRCAQNDGSGGLCSSPYGVYQFNSVASSQWA